MLKSWLLSCSLLIARATIEVWAYGDHDDTVAAAAEDQLAAPIWKRVEVVAGVETGDLGVREPEVVLEAVPEPDNAPYTAQDNGPRERAAPTMAMPRPTAAPSGCALQRRQDDGQLEALTSQLQSLSESATQALSSVSSSASSALSSMAQVTQSVRQSADQAVQSANQAADEANRRADESGRDIDRSLSSMSSRMSSERQSLESAVTRSVSEAWAQASASAAERMGEAASVIESLRAEASAAGLPSSDGNGGGGGDNGGGGGGGGSGGGISGATVAIIVVACVIGSAAITTTVLCLIMRHRRKNGRGGSSSGSSRGRQSPEAGQGGIATDEKAIAVRGASPAVIGSGTTQSPRSPRFTPWGGGTYPMDRMKLPAISALMSGSRRASADSRNGIGVATTSYDPQAQDGGVARALSATPQQQQQQQQQQQDQQQTNGFRLQKPDTIERAMSVRLIRVGSDKSSNSSNRSERGRARSRQAQDRQQQRDDGEGDTDKRRQPREPVPAVPTELPSSSEPSTPVDGATITTTMTSNPGASPPDSLPRTAYTQQTRSSVNSDRTSRTGSEPSRDSGPPRGRPVGRSATGSTSASNNSSGGANRFRFRDSTEDAESEIVPAGAATPNTFGPPSRRGTVGRRNTGSSLATTAAGGGHRNSLSTILSPRTGTSDHDDDNHNHGSNGDHGAPRESGEGIDGVLTAEDLTPPPPLPPPIPAQSPKRAALGSRGRSRSGSNSGAGGGGGGGATFAAFPKVRQQPPPRLNLGPPLTPPSATIAKPADAAPPASTTTTTPPLTPGSALAERIRAEAERRGREMVDAVRLGGEGAMNNNTISPGSSNGRSPNWPFSNVRKDL